MLNLFIVLGVFVLMEGFTWLAHRYIMHGFLWVLHKDHHHKEHDSKLEHNDYFFIIFALPAIVLMYLGSQRDYNYLFFIGVGITIYGMAYFFVHDIFIHQRIRLLRDTKNPYLLAIRRAHKQHHKHLGKHQGECYGFLWIPMKYFRMYFNKNGKV
jgi:beta-carotene 3-hydroxylase